MITELNDYQEQAVKTMKAMEWLEENKYCAMKLCEEAGEVVQMVAKHAYHDKPFDKEHLKEELSDILWYVANMGKSNGFTLSEIATFNIEKLKKRHGEKYNPEHYIG